MSEEMGSTKSSRYIRPNWKFWAAKHYWSVDEAAALINLIEPGTEMDLAEDDLSVVRMLKQFVLGQIEDGALPKHFRPTQFVALSSDALKPYGVPLEMAKAVRNYAEDPEKAYRELAAEFEKARAENEELKRQLRQQRELDPRERKTLYQILIVLAKEHYRFNEKKNNNAVKQLQELLTKYGIKELKYDAIRRHLVEAANEYHPSEDI